MSDFDRAFAIVVGEEGHYANDPHDPGGETMYGVTKSVARQYGYLGDMRNLPLDTAKVIYRRRYWDLISGDALPEAWSVLALDCAINQGPQTAIKIMQDSVNVVVDGVIGPNTLAALGAASDWHRHRFMALRAKRYMETANFDRYGTGWLTRLFSVVDKARA